MREIKLTQGFTTFVDDEDFHYLSQFSWCICKGIRTNYARRGKWIDGKERTIRMHREIMKVPKELEVDHIDHNGLNNQKSNLRICTHQENHYNKKPRGRTQYIGVNYYKKSIVASIKVNGKRLHLGYFKTEEDAAKAHDIAAMKYFKEFANLNFPNN